jgi:hypothetical protein
MPPVSWQADQPRLPARVAVFLDIAGNRWDWAP